MNKEHRHLLWFEADKLAEGFKTFGIEFHGPVLHKSQIVKLYL